MSRSFRKFPRNRHNRSHMKKAFNRGLRQKIKNGLFDECLLSGSDYRKFYSSYDISEGYPVYPLYRAIQPSVEIERPLVFYKFLGFDERNNPIMSEKEVRQGLVSYKVNTKFFDYPPSYSRKKSYPKAAIQCDGFEDWFKAVIRK